MATKIRDFLILHCLCLCAALKNQWIELTNHFKTLQESGLLNGQFTQEELSKIETLITNEEKKRFELVNKCLQKKMIPSSKYLKFGESMAFLERCNLTLKYFTEMEKSELYRIWGV